MNECYTNIIGLSRQDCPCVDDAPPTGYNTSKSGLYITDITPFDNLEGFDDCGEGNIWTLLSRSREDAINTFIADTNSMLMTRFTGRKDRFTGQVGEGTGREVLTTTKIYAGVRFAVNPIRGGRIKITKIGTLFSAVGTVSLSIYNSLGVQVGSSITLNTSNGFTINELEEPIYLPTFIEFADRHEYFFVYTYNASNKPRINVVGACGSCNFNPWFDTSKPMWSNSRYTGGKAWANWFMAGGWTGDNLTDFDLCHYSSTTEMNGLSFHLEAGCDVSKVLCAGTEFNFTDDPFALSIAYAIRHKACEILASRILGSTQLNRQNMINREHLQPMKKEWNQGYVDNVTYVVEQAKGGNGDCLVCRDESGLAVKTMLA